MPRLSKTAEAYATIESMRRLATIAYAQVESGGDPEYVKQLLARIVDDGGLPLDGLPEDQAIARNPLISGSDRGNRLASAGNGMYCPSQK